MDSFIMGKHKRKLTPAEKAEKKRESIGVRRKYRCQGYTFDKRRKYRCQGYTFDKQPFPDRLGALSHSYRRRRPWEDS
jgi:hypothetical protein